jgi:hypothetical protein
MISLRLFFFLAGAAVGVAEDAGLLTVTAARVRVAKGSALR